MTPNPIGIGNGKISPDNSSNLYNSIAKRGMPLDENSQQSEQPVAANNPADDAMERFGAVFNQFNTLAQTPDYSGASKEADLVKRAMQNWIQAVISSVPQVGGESNTL